MNSKHVIEKVKNDELLQKMERAKSISGWSFIWLLMFINGALLELTQPGSMKIVLFDILPKVVIEFILPAMLLSIVPLGLLIVYIASRHRIYQLNEILSRIETTSFNGELFEVAERLKDSATVVEDEAILRAWHELEEEIVR